MSKLNYLTVKQFAELHKISNERVRQLINNGRITDYVKFPHCTLISNKQQYVRRNPGRPKK